MSLQRASAFERERESVCVCVCIIQHVRRGVETIEIVFDIVCYFSFPSFFCTHIKLQSMDRALCVWCADRINIMTVNL